MRRTVRYGQLRAAVEATPRLDARGQPTGRWCCRWADPQHVPPALLAVIPARKTFLVGDYSPRAAAHGICLDKIRQTDRTMPRMLWLEAKASHYTRPMDGRKDAAQAQLTDTVGVTCGDDATLLRAKEYLGEITRDRKETRQAENIRESIERRRAAEWLLGKR